MNAIKKAAVLLTTFLMTTMTCPTTYADDFDDNLVRAIGYGVVPQTDTADNPSNKNYARQGARLDALRNVSYQINGIIGQYKVESVEDEHFRMSLDDSSVGKRIAVKLARQVGAARFIEKDICEITLQLPIFGSNSIAAEYFSDLKDTRPDPLPRPSTSVKLHSHYSGLIVDCRQLQIFRTLNPIIATDNDVVIFGAHNVGYDILIARGLVRYSKDINDRLRVGNKPLIVKAVSRDNGGNPIVSRVDADKILAANLADGFLARADVMFVF